ncbi:MAG: hypothetical protein ABIH50_06700 [bacterium]
MSVQLVSGRPNSYRTNPGGVLRAGEQLQQALKGAVVNGRAFDRKDALTGENEGILSLNINAVPTKSLLDVVVDIIGNAVARMFGKGPRPGVMISRGEEKKVDGRV